MRDEVEARRFEVICSRFRFLSIAPAVHSLECCVKRDPNLNPTPTKFPLAMLVWTSTSSLELLGGYLAFDII